VEARTVLAHALVCDAITSLDDVLAKSVVCVLVHWLTYPEG